MLVYSAVVIFQSDHAVTDSGFVADESIGEGFEESAAIACALNIINTTTSDKKYFICFINGCLNNGEQ